MGREAADFASDRCGKIVTLKGSFTLRTGSCDHFAPMAHPTVFLAASALAFASSCVSASTVDESVGAPLAGTVHRLSPAEVEAVQNAAADRNINAPSLDDRAVPDGRIHGEIGFGIGTGGYTSVFGTAFIPLGDDGFAALSFERSDFGRRRFRR
jgi:hypothetical protein